MRRALCVTLLVASPSHAGGLVVGSGSPRGIGRAGTGMVGDDGAGALLVNPAAMARREGTRGQLGIAFVDEEVTWLGAADSPVVRDQSASDVVPSGAAFASVADGWVVGLGAMTAAVTDRGVRSPSDLPPGDLGNAFEFRYAGIAGTFQRDTVTLGVARRIGDTLALGIAVGASRVTIGETRRVWAGFSGRDVVGNPELDVETAFSGTDWFAPSAVAGLLYASTDAPLELGASISWMQTIEAEADVVAFAPSTAMAPRVVASDAAATVRVRQPLALRAGGRYVGERFVAELGGDLWLAPDAAASTTWHVRGVRVIDRSGVETALARVPSRISTRTHGALRAAVDAQLIAGFLWATTGYAYQVAGVAGGRQSPTFADLGGHTLALGLEGTAGGFTFTLGWSRTWARARRPIPALALDNPFGAGDRLVPEGRYDGSIDQIGVLVDAEWDAPD